MSFVFATLLCVTAGQVRAAELNVAVANIRSGAVGVTIDGPDGKELGRGKVVQKFSGNELSVSAEHSLQDGSRVEEASSFTLKPFLQQRSWSWTQRRGDVIFRRFSADFISGVAKGFKQRGQTVQRWEEKLRIKPGRTFGGPGFVLVLQALGPQLKIRPMKLEAIAFTPKPRIVTVQLRYSGEESRFGKRLDHYVLHPSLGWLIQAIVRPPDFDVWLTKEESPQLGAVAGLLFEPTDPIVVIRAVD